MNSEWRSFLKPHAVLTGRPAGARSPRRRVAHSSRSRRGRPRQTRAPQTGPAASPMRRGGGGRLGRSWLLGSFLRKIPQLGHFANKVQLYRICPQDNPQEIAHLPTFCVELVYDDAYKPSTSRCGVVPLGFWDGDGKNRSRKSGQRPGLPARGDRPVECRGPAKRRDAGGSGRAVERCKVPNPSSDMAGKGRWSAGV